MALIQTTSFEGTLLNFDMKIICHLGSLFAAAALMAPCPAAWALTGKSTLDCESEIGDVPVNVRQYLLIKCLLGSTDHVRTAEEKVEWSSKLSAELEKQEKQEKQEKADRLIQAPLTLKRLSKNDFCVAFGLSLRGGEIKQVGPSEEVAALVKVEATRRKLLFNLSLIRSQKIRIGLSECELLASWGYPTSQNRTVGSWGIHTQHVFETTYVYTENGRITSWQD